MFELSLGEILGAAREKKLLNKDHIRIRTTGEDYLLNDGWREIGAALRRAIEANNRPVRAAEDSWSVG